MEFESFNYLKEGICYGIVSEIKKDKICIKFKDTVKCFDKNIQYINLNVGDYVRLYIKNDDVILLEKITKEFYEEIEKILSEF